MATFTITTAQNIDELAGKTGGDVYNINGGTLTIDQHSRFGLNNSNAGATTATSMGNITLSATLGGTINIDGRYVRMIPYNSGSGTLPALNSLVTQGSASGKLVCVYSSLTAAPVTTGTIPASGWIMVKQWNGIAYAAGALTLSGITATATGADTQGFLEIFGDDAGTVTVNRLNTLNILGAWYELGNTNGSAGQTFQIPNHGTLRHFAGVFIEKTAGSGDYEFYPNGGTTTTTGTTVATGNEEARGKIVWINNTGLVTIGNSGGTGLNGFVPGSGRKVVVPNIFLCCCTTAARNAEVIPNATLATRYDFTTTGGGVINIDKANMCWYPSIAQAYSCNLSNTGIIDAINISEIATAMTWTKVGVGNKPTTALATNPLVVSLCFAGGTFTDCVFSRTVTTANGSTASTLTDMDGFTFVGCTFRYNALRAHTTPASVTATRVNNSSFTNCVVIDGQMNLITCANISITGTVFVNATVGTTGTTNPLSVWSLSSSCSNVTISGLSLPVTNNQPYTALLSIAAAGCINTKLRSIGTRSAPLSLGSANACGLIFTLGTGAAAVDTYVQRVYCSNTRTGIMTADNSSTKLYMDNVYGDYADAADVSAAINMQQRALGTTKALTAQTAVYGTHWIDYFTATTAGRIAIVMNEPTAFTADQVALTSGAAFTSTGGLYMPTIGMTATFTTPYFIKGHTSFQNSALVMAGGTVGNYTFRYQIDKGSGFSAWSSSLTAAQLGTALNGETGIDPAIGIKLKIEITTGTTNTTAITSVYVLTNSSAAAQDNEYPLDVNTITFTGLQTGSDVVIYEAGTTNVLGSVDANGTTSWGYTYSGADTIDVGVFKAGYIPFYIRNLSITTSDASLPIAQVADRAYLD